MSITSGGLSLECCRCLHTSFVVSWCLKILQCFCSFTSSECPIYLPATAEASSLNLQLLFHCCIWDHWFILVVSIYIFCSWIMVVNVSSFKILWAEIRLNRLSSGRVSASLTKGKKKNRSQNVVPHSCSPPEETSILRLVCICYTAHFIYFQQSLPADAMMCSYGR